MFKNIALLTFPSQEIERPPAAIAALGGICQSLGIAYKVFDLNLMSANLLDQEDYRLCEEHWRTDQTIALPNSWFRLMNSVILEIQLGSFDLIAVSVFSKFSTRSSHLFLTQLKSQVDILTVAGGQGLTTPYGKTTYGKTLLERELVAYIATGDGEIIFNHWLQEDFNVPGTNDLPPVQIDDLESLPLPDFSKIKPSDYHSNGRPGIYVTASRGCVRSCKFCDVPWRWPKYRYRKGITVANELYYHYQQTGVTTFQFTDSVINGNLKEFLAMQTRLSDLRLQDAGFDVRWLSQFNIRRKKDMPESLYAAMQSGGAELLICGVEHASWDVRQHMGKEFNNDDLDWHIKMCAKYGIKNIFLMFVGYPTETLQDHTENLEFLSRYQKYMLAGTIVMIRWGYTGSIDHGSKLETKGDLVNIVPEWPGLDLGHMQGQDQDWLYGRNWVNLDNPDLTLRERLRRRLEVQEKSFELGWPVTRSKEELDILYIIADQLLGEKKIVPINLGVIDH